MQKIYISTPNPVMLCFDRVEGYHREGRLYHLYCEEATVFENVEQIFYVMENLFDELKFPFSSTTDRSFLPQKERKPKAKKELHRVKSDEELLEQRGRVATFFVQVQQRKNSSWAGLVTHIEQEKSTHFRSVLELLKFIERGLCMENKTF